jgi:uncharacterized membrane protein YjgN (DUF898 family)
MDTGDTFQVQFKGDAQTYFGIWIVNLMLSIVTFGIYSAWAKVRTKKYFAQNTTIDGRRFDYHATGKQILIGRAIVVVALILYSALSVIPVLGLVLGLGFICVSPYLINRSLKFSARMTSFSGLRFGFDGTFWQALKVFVIYPILCFFTLYLAWPFVARAQQRYYVQNHRYGTAQFDFESGVGPFYKALIFAILWGVGFIIAITGAFFGSALASGQLSGEDPFGMTLGAMQLVPLVIIIVAVLPAGFIYRAYIRNAVYAAASVQGGHELTSTVKPMALVWIAISNALVVMVSFGLMLPWAHVRMTHYLARNTYITVNGSLDAFVGTQEEQVGALGDAFTDFEGIDVDFAL